MIMVIILSEKYEIIYLCNPNLVLKYEEIIKILNEKNDRL